MITDELRNGFLDFFRSKGHKVVRSSSVVPHNDPTILFTNAGMNQFKHVFTGEEKRYYNRAASCQKCVRAGGKHNDLENVGYTARHHTFFEMLGNFSFGDYFKKDAIAYGWEYVTKHLNLQKDKLWVSVYKDDEEAYAIWQKEIKIPKERIVKLGQKDNFWSMGETGPCGPCSEIFYDLGKEVGCKEKNCSPACDCGRYVEFWNLVFMEFNRDEKGKMHKLPSPSIDTGMGLERVSAIKQGVLSNYDIDIFKPLLSHIGELSKKKYDSEDEDSKISMRAIADHARACCFLISEGIVPSNEGRGYVLRRIVRRALRHGHLLGLKDPFLFKLIDNVVDTMSGFYTELKEEAESVRTIVENEEKSFLETLAKGMQIVGQQIGQLKKGDLFPGYKAFDLYQTYGFPLDLTQDALKKHGIKVDITAFEKAFEDHRMKAKGSFTSQEEEKLSMDDFNGLPPTDFTGYSGAFESEAKLLKCSVVDSSRGEVALAFDKTPFYAESGGQIGDEGVAEGKNYKVEIYDTLKSPSSVWIHRGKMIKDDPDKIKEGETVKLSVSKDRLSTMRNHTATHLLHKALQDNLGKHVKQAGSLVDPKRLRFDFSHTSGISQDVLRKIEDDVNAKILENIPLKKEVMPIDKARKMGAMALFGEKYGESVRVVSVPGYSIELCGGTHVQRTGDIGLFKIISEGSVASGLRRIEAVTGQNAIVEFRKSEDAVNRASLIMKIQTSEFLPRLEKLSKRVKELEKKISSGGTIDKKSRSSELLSKAKSVGDFKLLSEETQVDSPKDLREMADLMLDKLQKGIVVLGTRSGKKAFLTAKISRDLTSKYSAKDLIMDISKIIGGGGGGKAEIAEAGGSKPEKLKEALLKVYEIIS